MRSKRITKALLEAGFEVDVVLGGTETPAEFPAGATCFQLNPYKSGPGGFSALMDANNQYIDEAYKAQRLEQLLSLLQARAPDVVFTEAFPFARHQMGFEFMPFLEAVKQLTPRPLVACSVRDLLHKKVESGRDELTIRILREHYDFVFLHADPEFARLDETFRLAGKVSDLTHYTGLVAPEVSERCEGRIYDVVVSAGGGAVGKPLFEAALEAMPRTRYAKDRWGFITGPNLPLETIEKLKQETRPNLTIESFRTDFFGLLKEAKVLVSQSGYNTSADILRSGCRSVMVPFVMKGLSEQLQRASLFEQRGLTVLLKQENLDANSLAAAIDKAGEMAPPDPKQIPKLDGAFETARILKEFFERSTEDEPKFARSPV